VKLQRSIPRRGNEQGIVILLVAVMMLFVIGAIAALAIDFVSFYTARSEAQLAVDSAALAGARVLANSGVTSDPTNVGLLTSSELLARAVAGKVAATNKVGGRFLLPTEITIPPILTAPSGVQGNLLFTVSVTRNDIPTFFARVFGKSSVTIGATAVAEVYNPSNASAILSAGTVVPPVAPICVKPWLLPNLDPTGGAGPIFTLPSGAANTALLGAQWTGSGIVALCNSCTVPVPAATAGGYYPGLIGPADFASPTSSIPQGASGFNPYPLAVAACVPKPITCGQNATINIDTNTYTPQTTDRNADTVAAIKVAIHDNGANGDSDSIDPTWTLGQPFQFVAGNANPISGAISKTVFVSDSLATIPVFDTNGFNPASPNPVNVIGFVQVFLNPQANTLTGPGIPATIVNLAGCGTAASGPPIIGNGASPVPVRLISQ
jgi:hypothetical protein